MVNPVFSRNEILPATNDRLLYIDRAKGLVIVFVVFGHLAARTSPPDNLWFDEAKRLIYMFHMPIFMFLSGYVFWFSRSSEKAISNYGRFVSRRAERYLLPFFAIGIIVLLAKITLANFVQVDSVPDSIGSGLYDLLFYTWGSPVLFIWYLFVIFVYACTFPLLINAAKLNIWAIFLFSVALYFVNFQPFLYADVVARYFVFFVAGVIACKFSAQFDLLTKLGYLFIPAFIGSLVYFYYYDGSAAMLIVGLCSLPPAIWLVRFGPLRDTRWTLALGAYAFSIYLMNVIVIGVLKAVLLRFLPWGGPIFPAFATLLLVSGVMIPVIIKHYVFGRIPYLDRMTS